MHMFEGTKLVKITSGGQQARRGNLTRITVEYVYQGDKNSLTSSKLPLKPTLFIFNTVVQTIFFLKKVATEEKRKKNGWKKMIKIVATIVDASRPHEHRPTGTPTAPGNRQIND